MITILENSLAMLSDSQIITRLDALVQKERETTLEVLRHIIEFDRRKLYLSIGCSSLYQYCTLHLGYSEAAAMRRIQAARCIMKFPEAYRVLEKNELTLIGICKLAGILNEENKDELLQEARCKSSRQIEAIVARHNPTDTVRERVRPIFVRAGTEEPAKTNAFEAGDSKIKNGKCTDPKQEHSPQDNWVKFTFGAEGKKLTTCSKPSQHTTVLKKKYKLEFAVSPECMKKLEEAKAILSRKYPDGVPLGKLLEETLDAYLDKNSFERKRKRREKHKAAGKKQNSHQDRRSCNNETENSRTNPAGRIKNKNASSNQRSRHIPQVIRDDVFARDGGRCTYVGPDGVRCNSKWNVEIDHIKPYAKGGGYSIHNLRLLCARHNQYEAERIYGKEFMDRQRFMENQG